MTDIDMGLHLLPEHMRDAARNWVEHHQPEPLLMGSFFRSVLRDSLTTAWVYADQANRESLAAWAQWLHDYAPSRCWGSSSQLQDWHNARPNK